MKEEGPCHGRRSSEAFLHGPQREARCWPRCSAAVVGQAVAVLHGDVLRVLLPRAHRARRRRGRHGADGHRHRDRRAARARLRLAERTAYGRKPPLLAGLAFAVLLYFPLFGALLDAANPALARRGRRAGRRACGPRRVLAAVRPDGPARFRRQFLRRRQVAPRPRRHRPRDRSRSRRRRRRGSRSASVVMAAPDPARLAPDASAAAIADFERRARGCARSRGPRAALADPAAHRPSARRGDPRRAARSSPRSSPAPYSALLAELFPARIRYTALSFPQNFGNGWFGGLLPAVAFTIVAATGERVRGALVSGRPRGALPRRRRAGAARDARTSDRSLGATSSSSRARSASLTSRRPGRSFPPCFPPRRRRAAARPAPRSRGSGASPRVVKRLSATTSRGARKCLSGPS